MHRFILSIIACVFLSVQVVSAQMVMELISPADNETDVYTTTMLVWHAYPGGESYRVRIQFVGEQIETTVTDTFVEVTLPYGNQEYEWTVFCGTFFAPPCNFTTRMRPPEMIGTQTYGYIRGLFPKIEWAPAVCLDVASGCVDSYDLQISYNSDYSDLLFDTAGIIDTFYQVTDTLQTDVRIYYRVRGHNYGGVSKWFERYFTIDPIPEAPILSCPDTVGSDSIHLSWTDTDLSSRGYHLEIYNDTGLVFNDSNLNYDSITIHVEEGIYTWRVRIEDREGWGPYSELDTFVVRIPATETKYSAPVKRNTRTLYEAYDLRGRHVSKVLNPRDASPAGVYLFKSSQSYRFFHLMKLY